MGWFGPSGDCGCCDLIDCETIDCDDYDLEPCECVEVPSGTIRTLDEVDWYFAGSTAGGNTPSIGSIPSVYLPPVDYSGTYNVAVSVVSGFCIGATSGGTGDVYIISQTFLGTAFSSDWWAILYVHKVPNVSPFTLFMSSDIISVPIGQTPNASRSNWTGFWAFESWDFTQDSKVCAGEPCVCQRTGDLVGGLTSAVYLNGGATVHAINTIAVGDIYADYIYV